MALEDSNLSSAKAVSPNALLPNAPSPSAPKASSVTVALTGVSAAPSASATLPVPAPEDKTVITKRPPMSLEQMPTATLLPNPAASLTGMRLEHYELVEFVGGGGMGSVYRATDTRLGRTVAVKVLSRDQGDEETIRRFRIEAQSAARLDHPNIARVYYVGEDQGVNFIVFEFIEGVNLRDEVQASGPIDLERALYYTLQIAQALGHSSGRDVIHRDIKPSNVLLTAAGQVKLVDMGLARLHQVEPSANDLTASGVMLGTFDYISPEQARDPRVADVRSDLYSLGCTLFFMLAGQPPFPEGTALQKVLRHSTDEPPDVRQFRPELGTRVAALVSRLLSKKPSQRHQS
ncbi:MAG TPA: serine/threonine-protein kinase, partial [Pirellulaceae bacterium]